MAATARDALLRWYDRTARDLPWRRTDDPYAIWVAEIMLQQTRVETVIPYYARFLKRFPTPSELARADEGDVLAQWSGLGYYRRARLLHSGAREVVERYGGRVPQDRQARLSLPGVGRYTAGAIGSIAFGRCEPIVDGNVARVLARLHAVDTPLGRAVTERRLWGLAQDMVEGRRPGALNQALMELGARVCTPSAPDCDRCPVRRWCAARRAGRAESLPVPKPRKDPVRVRLAAVVPVRRARNGRALRVWLVRARGQLFGGLWGVPMAPAADVDRTTARAALREAGIMARLDAKPVGSVEHVLSHRRLDVQVWKAKAARAVESDDRRLVALDELGRLGVSRLTRKLLHEALGACL